MNKLFTKIVGAALGLTMAVGVGVGFGVGASKEAVPVKAAVGDETTLFDVTNKANWKKSYTSYNATEWTDDVPDNTFAYAANNNKGWAYVKLCPGKGATNTSYIKCNTATTSLTRTVTITVASNDSSTSFSNVYLYVYSNSTFSTLVDTTTFNENSYGAGTLTFNPSNSYGQDNWATGVYFKFSIDVTNSSTSKNYGTCISKIVAIEGAEASSSNCAEIELANYPTSNFGVGETAQLSYNALDDSAETWNGEVTYTSSNTSVATVSSTGLLTAVGVGQTTVSVQDTDGNADPDSQVITVVSNYFYPVTSQDDLLDGAKVVIVGENSGNYYAMNDTVTSYKCGTTSVSRTSYGGKTVVIPSATLVTWTVGISGDEFTLLSDNSKYLRGYIYNSTTPEVVTSATSSNTGNKWALSANSTSGYNLKSDASVYTYLASASAFDGASSEQSAGLFLYQLCKGTPAITKAVPNTSSISVNTSSGADTFTFTLHPSYASGTATAVSGNTDVATVATTGTTVTVTPVGNGSTTITFVDGESNALEGSVSVTSTVVVSYDSLRVDGTLGGSPYYVGDEITDSMLENITVYGVKEGESDTLLASGYTLTVSPIELENAGNTTIRVTATYDANPSITGYKEFTITVNEKPYASKITSLDDLWDGQEVYIGNSTDRVWGHYSSGNNIQATANSSQYHATKGVSISDTSGAAYRIGRVYDADAEAIYYTFSYEKNGTTYYLYSSASGSNYMKGDMTTLNNTGYWTISEGSNSGQWSIHNVGNTTRYMQTNGNYLSCYTNGQTNPYLYLTTAYNATTVADSFKQNALHFDSYDSSKATEGTNDGSGWCKDETHNYYAHAKRVWNAMSTDERTAVDSDGINRLSAWASANGDVLNGTNALSARVAPMINIISGTNSTTAIIVIVSLVSITAIGGYFFIRKRKEQ